MAKLSGVARDSKLPATPKGVPAQEPQRDQCNYGHGLARGSFAAITCTGTSTSTRPTVHETGNSLLQQGGHTSTILSAWPS
jgi:hypothetical protein